MSRHTHTLLFLSVCLSICLSICLSVCVCVCVPVRLCVSVIHSSEAIENEARRWDVSPCVSMSTSSGKREREKEQEHGRHQ